MEACPFSNEACRHYDTPQGCRADTHHLAYPKRDYKTPLEKRFRKLPENIVELPRCVHDILHAEYEPPIKPTVQQMRDAISGIALEEWDNDAA